MKYILSIILFFLLAGSLSAQNEQDQVIFKAMQDEMQRSKEQLMLPGMQKPYYLSYTLGRTHQFEVVGALGGVTNFYESPWSAVGGVQMFLGDYDHNNDINYVCASVQAGMPEQADYDVIRRNFWLGSDAMYKWSLQAGAMKDAYLKANPKTACLLYTSPSPRD